MHCTLGYGDEVSLPAVVRPPHRRRRRAIDEEGGEEEEVSQGAVGQGAEVPLEREVAPGRLPAHAGVQPTQEDRQRHGGHEGQHRLGQRRLGGLGPGCRVHHPAAVRRGH